MSTVSVIITEEEQAAAGLESPEVHYTNADGQVIDGLLLIRQQYRIVAEYPAGRFVSWTVEEDAP
jgi:hypothetical protein